MLGNLGGSCKTDCDTRSSFQKCMESGIALCLCSVQAYFCMPGTKLFSFLLGNDDKLLLRGGNSAKCRRSVRNNHLTYGSCFVSVA